MTPSCRLRASLGFRQDSRGASRLHFFPPSFTPRFGGNRGRGRFLRPHLAGTGSSLCFLFPFNFSRLGVRHFFSATWSKTTWSLGCETPADDASIRVGRPDVDARRSAGSSCERSELLPKKMLWRVWRSGVSGCPRGNQGLANATWQVLCG